MDLLSVRSTASSTGLRILFFADASSVHTQRWVSEMVARGHQCWVVTRLAGAVPGAQAVHVVQPGLAKAGWFKALLTIRHLAKVLQPDWVHGHYVTGYGLWAAACGVRPLALTAWGSDILVTPQESAVMRSLVGWSLRRADLITADSQDVLVAIKGYGVRAPCVQILWGADTDKFQPTAVLPADFDIVSLRSWEPNYNIDIILAGFAMLLRQRPHLNARLHLLGGGSAEAALRKQAQQLSIQERVVFRGRVGDTEMIEVMQRARVSISIPTSDATSVSVLESMACGLPVIASDLPANRQWIEAQGGRLLAARDSQALGLALVALSDMPAEQLTAMGLYNRDLVQAQAARRGQMDAMSDLYHYVRAHWQVAQR